MEECVNKNSVSLLNQMKCLEYSESGENLNGCHYVACSWVMALGVFGT
jgi:hypothetical protein